MKWAGEHKFGIWAFAVAVAFIPGIMSSALAGRWAVIAIGIPLVGQISFRFSPVIQATLAMGFAWAIASLMITPDVKDASLQLFFMILLIAVMGAASQVETLDGAMAGMCWGVGISSALCLFTILWGHPVVAQTSSYYAGLFFNSEVLTELAAPLLVWAICSRRWDLAAATVVPVLVNTSRVAALVVVLSLLYAYRPRSKWVWLAMMAGGAAVLGTLLWHYSMGNSKVGSALLRIFDWEWTALSITPSGRGIGWFRVTHMGEEFAHSDVLQAMAELGLGSLCFAVIPFYIFRNSRGTYAERAAFFAICIEMVISFPLHVPATAFLAALLTGYLASDRPVVRRVRLDGGIQDGADDQRYAAASGYGFGGGGFGNFMVPVRRAFEGLSSVGEGAGLRKGNNQCRR